MFLNPINLTTKINHKKPVIDALSLTVEFHSSWKIKLDIGSHLSTRTLNLTFRRINIMAIATHITIFL